MPQETHRNGAAAMASPSEIRILFVEDEINLQRSLTYILEKEGFAMTAVRTGEEAIESVRARRPDLVLLDPYDFLAEWEELLPRALALAERSVVLAYIYNRAPRSAGYWNEYQRLRNALASGREGEGYVLGRIPTDAVLPRAYHEVLLLGGRQLVDVVRETLRGLTRALARSLADTGAFEEQA